MSFDISWDINQYKTEHESEEQWALRKTFMEKWKNDYPEDRLICLAQIFANIEFLGCRYPLKVMQEVSSLSFGIADNYRKKKLTKLQRTFVSASDAAVDRARGVKREGGVVIEPPKKSSKIEFVPQGSNDITEPMIEEKDNKTDKSEKEIEYSKPNSIPQNLIQPHFIEELEKMACLNVKQFSVNMFNTIYGKLVLLVRPWMTKLSNITASCQSCQLNLQMTQELNTTSIYINEIVLAKVIGTKTQCENLAWANLIKQAPSIYYKEQWTKDSQCVSVSDVRKEEVFGTRVENAVAMKMMKIMGWKGGGLGADCQGISEPIKPHLQLIGRAGLGAFTQDVAQIKNAGKRLMKKYMEAESIDVDLIFSSEFSKEERALLHRVAQSLRLVSKSYGSGDDRFLVVKKRTDVFTLFRTIVNKGGETSKFKVYLPISLADNK